jgi:hypothetical protein
MGAWRECVLVITIVPADGRSSSWRRRRLLLLSVSPEPPLEPERQQNGQAEQGHQEGHRIGGRAHRRACAARGRLGVVRGRHRDEIVRRLAEGPLLLVVRLLRLAHCLVVSRCVGRVDR